MSAVPFGALQIIASDLASAESVFAADFDTDGDVDVVASGNDEVVWYENQDATGVFKDKQIIDSDNGARQVHAADLDGDGDLDVLSASAGDGKIAWYENTGGRGYDGYFGEKLLISNDRPTPGADSLHAADLDGDGDLDVVVGARQQENSLFWYENVDGYGNFSDRQIINPQAVTVSSVHAADLDGDGDLDVLSASVGHIAHAPPEPKVSWYENLDGKGTFGAETIITTTVSTARAVHAADLDGDGDLDVLSASAGDGKIAWYENLDGTGTFGEQVVLSKLYEGAGCLYPADLDGDGDFDVLACEVNIGWYENVDGYGNFSDRQIILANPEGVKSIYPADLDGDGDLDVLSATWGNDTIAWYPQLGILAGDANRDNEFNQLDIVQVLQSGKYLTGEPATWEEGDWSGDGVFDQSDLIAALQASTYLHGSYLLQADTMSAEPWLFL